jgi:hypothetical protein
VAYNAAEEHVVFFRADEMTIAPDAKSGTSSAKLPLDRVSSIQAAQGETDSQRRYRGTLRGSDNNLGGHAPGTQSDIRTTASTRAPPRSARRVCIWCSTTPTSRKTTADAWVKDPKDPTRHYVKHYQIDFGKGLGFMSTFGDSLRRGYEYAVDFRAIAKQLFTLGLHRRAWERRAVVPALRGVGQYPADYDVDGWQPNSPAYVPFKKADRFDKFWGSKILIRFTREQLRAVVESVRLSDPKAVEYLVTSCRTATRRRRTGSARQPARHSRWMVRRCADDLPVTSSSAGRPLLVAA